MGMCDFCLQGTGRPLFHITCHYCNIGTSFRVQIDDVSLVYYRKEESELTQLDLEASIEELIEDSNLVSDK